MPPVSALKSQKEHKASDEVVPDTILQQSMGTDR